MATKTNHGITHNTSAPNRTLSLAILKTCSGSKNTSTGQNSRTWPIYDITGSTVPIHDSGSIHISKTASTQNPEVTELIQWVSKVTTAILREHVPSSGGTQHLRRWASSAVPTVGHHDNLCSTNTQVNCSDLKTALDDSIKTKGKPHVDKNDDTLIPSVILFLSNHPPEYYPGRMTLWATRLVLPSHTFGAAIMTGRTPNSTTGRGLYAHDFPKSKRYTSLPGAVVSIRPSSMEFGGRNIISYASMFSHRLKKVSYLSPEFYNVAGVSILLENIPVRQSAVVAR
ncbi:hypothetical protein IFR05_010497 [Cadophora sp. M221]|nr:hypothetical protein IFR05_010497 [Cadophora sp. M221]